MKPEDFRQQQPVFDLFDYFAGDTQAWGIFQDRFGTLKRQFKVDINGQLDGNTLTLDESFVYADGETDKRVWTITDLGDNRYSGTAGDIVGKASGVAAGNALQWQYTMNLKVGDSTYKVRFNDWMFLQDGNVLINRATVSKWGIKLGEVSLFFIKPE